MKGLHEGENIWEHLPGMDLNFYVVTSMLVTDVGDKLKMLVTELIY